MTKVMWYNSEKDKGVSEIKKNKDGKKRFVRYGYGKRGNYNTALLFDNAMIASDALQAWKQEDVQAGRIDVVEVERINGVVKIIGDANYQLYAFAVALHLVVDKPTRI